MLALPRSWFLPTPFQYRLWTWRVPKDGLPLLATIAIVIPVHNRAQVLGRALGSVLASTASDMEVIVVDDASTDSIASIIGGIRDPRLHFERLPSKANANVARNHGIAVSTAPVIAFLDSDDVFKPGRIERLVRYFEQHPAVDAVLDGFAVINGAREESAAVPSLSLDGEALADLLVSHALPLTCSSIAARRAALREIGGFDDSLPRHQDRDLLLRLSARHTVALGTGTDVVKYQSEDSISRDPVGYIAALDQLVGRHPRFRQEGFDDVLSYLACRVILKAILGGRLRSAIAEAQALTRTRHLPKSFLRGLLRYRQGRRARKFPHLSSIRPGGNDRTSP
jgi:glycosyltransferase involved in cell wall biosynthesis